MFTNAKTEYSDKAFLIKEITHSISVVFLEDDKLNSYLFQLHCTHI